MRFLNDYWGINENITPLEIAMRSAAMFVIALFMIRMAGMRPFGKENTFDTITTFLVGGILVRGVVGATPFFSTVASGIVILILHKLMSILTFYSKQIGWLAKGGNLLLYKDQKFFTANMKKANVTEHDIFEELRATTQLNDLEKIKEIYIERTGKISFVKIDNS
jgi:uncharacterized membrane protein YcaP (DUF421 family)